MPLRYDHPYLYRGYHGCPSYCWLRIYMTPGQTMVLATELEDNPGTSITNMAAGLATEVVRAFHLPLDTLVWIEHYPAHLGINGGARLPASFDRVTFTPTPQGLQSPQWCRLSQTEVEIFLGQTLPPHWWDATRRHALQEAL
jgi:hypothetical protein